MEIAVLAGLMMVLLGRRTQQNKERIQWMHGFVIAALVWIL
jgi:hypothetical protein